MLVTLLTLQIEDSSAIEVRKAIRRNDSSVVVMFHSPTCSHCINFLPHFSSAAAKLKNIVELYTIDCSIDINQQFCYYQECHSFPTVKMYNHQNSEDLRPITFYNQRVESALLNWISTNHRKPFKLVNTTKEAVQQLNTQEDDKQNLLVLMQAKKPNVLLYKLGNNMPKLNIIIYPLINEEKIEDLKKQIKIHPENQKIELFMQKSNGKMEKYNGEVNYENIEQWINTFK